MMKSPCYSYEVHADSLRQTRDKMNSQPFKKTIIYFVILSFLLTSCASTTTVAPTNTTTPSVTPLPTNTLTPTTTPIPNTIRDFALSPDGFKIAIYSYKGVYIYDSMTLEKIQFSDVGGDYRCGELAGAVAFSPDGAMIAIAPGYPDNLVFIQDIGTKLWIWRSYDIPNGNCPTEIEFNPEGNTIFVRSSSRSMGRCEYPEDSLELYTLDRMSDLFYESRILQTHWCRYNPARMRFLSDGRFYLFFGSLGDTYWIVTGNSKTGQVLEQREYDIPKDGWFYDISQDGQTLAISPFPSMFENATTNIVDLTSKQTLMVVPYYVKLLNEKDQFIVYDLYNSWKFWKNGDVACSYDFTTYPDLKFSADYNFMAAHTGDNQIEIWKVSTCEKINTILLSE